MATFNPNGRKKQPEPYPGFFTPPPGREIVAGFVDPRYGAGTVTRSSSPAIGSTPYAAPEDATVGSAPFPDIPPGYSQAPALNEADQNDADTIANFAAQPPSASDAPAMEESDEWQAEMDARVAALDANKEEINAIRAQADAAINRGQMPAAQAPAAQEATVKPPAPKSAFTPGVGFNKEPITFKSPGGEAWMEGDEAGFNSAAVENANPGWTGGSSWTSKATMGGAYNGSVMANPEKKRAPSQQTRDFYQRADDRGDTRRVNRFNARMGR